MNVGMSITISALESPSVTGPQPPPPSPPPQTSPPPVEECVQTIPNEELCKIAEFSNQRIDNADDDTHKEFRSIIKGIGSGDKAKSDIQNLELVRKIQEALKIPGT